MARILFATVLLAGLCSCGTLPPPPPRADDPCAAGEATYACQVERYRNANM